MIGQTTATTCGNRRLPAARLRRAVLLAATLCASLGPTFACSHLPPALTAQGRQLRRGALQWQGRRLALRQSHYYGELYDDNERLLLSPHDFATLYHRLDRRGRPILPGPAHGILPAGTAVIVEEVELPGGMAALKRMGNAPKAHIWLRLRLPDGAPPLTGGHGRSLVVVLPGQQHDAVSLHEALAAALAPEEEVAAWLAALRPPIRAAVKHKWAMRGMDSAAVRAALGEPWQWLGDTLQGRACTVAWWPGQELWLQDDVVVDVRRPRQLATPPAN